MNLALFTLSLHSNYGGILQAYALQTILERMGHQVVVLNKPPHPHRLRLLKKPFCYAKRLLLKLFVDPKTIIHKEDRIFAESILIRQHTDRFIYRYIHNRWLIDLKDFQEGEVDGIVVGSDQIWRPKYFVGWSRDLSDAFLAFAEKWNVKRWAYAASFGTDTWDFPKKQTPRYAQLMQQFLAVSVREDTGVTLCRDHLHVEAQHLLDPTLLLTADDYLALIDTYDRENNHSPFTIRHSPKNSSSPKILTTYLLDPTPEKQALVQRVAEERGLTPCRIGTEVNEDEQDKVPLEQRIAPPIEEWLKGFRDADLVLTDSFHGCVFSILFRKPFIVLGNAKRGLSRMQSLLRMFHLESHLLLTPSDYDPSLPYTLPADLPHTHDQLRQRSLAFLKQIQ